MINKNKKQIKLKQIQIKAAKIHYRLLIAIITPTILLIIGLLFSMEIVSAIGFWSIVIIFCLYLCILNIYNYKIHKLIKKMQNE